MFKNICVSVWKHGRRVVEEAIRGEKFKPTAKFPRRDQDGGIRSRKSIYSCEQQGAVFQKTWIRSIVGNNVQRFAFNLRKIGAQQLQSGPFSLFSRSFAQRSLAPRMPLYAFVGVGLAVRTQFDSDSDNLQHKVLITDIQDVVTKCNKSLEEQVNDCPQQDLYGHDVNNYEFGSMISKGCNAAVYEAKQVEEEPSKFSSLPDNDTREQEHTLEQTVEENDFTLLDPEIEELENHETEQRSSSYNLAIKVMFNLYYESNQPTILRGMEKEILPAKEVCEKSRSFLWSFGSHPKKKRRILAPHPNIIEMKQVFVDDMMAFDECHTEYPDSLPSRLHSTGIGKNKTMYIVMKRYPCTLREYVRRKEVNCEESLLLFSQLLEGLLHLNKANIAHRDLKSDNILVETKSSGIELVISDFGCCLEGLQIPYNTPEVDKGGNFALMAPEIVNAEPSDTAYLDYTKSDLWAAGALAYEIFGKENPFYSYGYSGLSSGSYNEEKLPDFNESVPDYVSNLVKMMLKKDPAKRPDVLLAANTVQLMLWAPKEWIDSLCNQSQQVPPTKEEVLNWLFILVTGYILSDTRCVQHRLKEMFLSRLDLDDLMNTVHYLWNLNNID